MNKKEPSSVGRRVMRYGLLSMIPGYSIYRALASLKESVNTGAETIRDNNRELAERRKRKRVSTYNEALTKRTEESMSLAEIDRLSKRRKRMFLAAAFISAAFVLGSVVAKNYLGSLLGLLFILFCLLHVVKYEHRLWQMETGAKAPDEPLGSFGQFFASRGAFRRIFNPYLF